MILTRAEVAELTGRKTRAGQIEVLKRYGVHHLVAGDGWPRVLDAWLVSVLPEPPEPKPVRPHQWMSKEWRNWIRTRQQIVSAAPRAVPYTTDEHIYALIDGNEIIYIGRSHDVEYRWHRHRVMGRRFDRVWVLTGFPDACVDLMEAMYIHGLEPVENTLIPLRPDCIPSDVHLPSLFNEGEP